MKAGRVAGRATHLFKGAKTLWDKRKIAEGGESSTLKIFQTLRVYHSPKDMFNPEIFPDDASKKDFATRLEMDLWLFFLECVRKGDHKTLHLFADAVEHFENKGVGDLDAVKKHILMAYAYLTKGTKTPPTKRQLYDYFFENFDYKKMHFEDFCHRADPLFLKFKKPEKRKRNSKS